MSRTLTTCRRCHTPLSPVYPGQREHPLCSPAPKGWIPPDGEHHRRTLQLALAHAARGWHVLPLSPDSKRPLGNCPACRDYDNGKPPHRIEDCPCIPAGAWCHGVRGATTAPATITNWWQNQPDAIPGIATGPSRLCLIDIDNHNAPFPAEPATALLPGIDLTAENLPEALWRDQSAFRDGRDSLRLLTRLRGGEHPWPTGSAYQPVTVNTPSGGRHLWYQAPAADLRQALAPHGIAWQVDIKAGWSYGIAPGATTSKGTYRTTSGHLDAPGRMPDWLAREVIRVAGHAHRPRPPAQPRPRPHRETDLGPAAYLTTVINRGTARLVGLTDGRKRALAALAYQAGGLLDWSGLPHDQVTEQLTTAGTTAGLTHTTAARIVRRSLARGLDEPLPEPSGLRR
ncbi:bifunctional DNA primase/polymerase [Actinoallomurus sp. NBC_01490]|uniref:bifunctional DNA primase/polymerase n=1 Tax=Actinoallomurus sp. NBC_01490 TaxID=2903557 RepID=UPI002E2F8AC8|nr:bifunctional DNA primase/polymerase [Actinoallomurus sp. NBC_01490]